MENVLESLASALLDGGVPLGDEVLSNDEVRTQFNHAGYEGVKQTALAHPSRSFYLDNALLLTDGLAG
jgi:hypothetical protein